MRISSDFEGGNAEAVEILDPGHLRFRARADQSPRPLWFSFRIEGAAQPVVRCDLINADACFGPRFGWRNARPVFSPNGRHWQRVQGRYVEESAAKGYFTFDVPIVGRCTHVAFSHPYTTADLAPLVGRLEADPRWMVSELCRSAEGRPVWLLSRASSAEPSAGLWILARQHAGEAPASHVVEGVISALVRLDPPEQWSFNVVPMVDVDGVFHGRYGKDQAPADFNRDWHAGVSLPQIRGLMDRLREAAGASRTLLVFDLHAPHSADTGCYFLSEEIPPESRAASVLLELAALAPPPIGYSSADLRLAPAPKHSARAFALSLGAEALTLEASYHLGKKGDLLTPRDYHCFGEALGEALVHAIGKRPADKREEVANL